MVAQGGVISTSSCFLSLPRHCRPSSTKPPRLALVAMSDDPIREWILSEGKATKIIRISPVGGGCINLASRYDTDAGSFFVKTNRSIGPSMFEGEALGLGAMYETRSIRVPRPYKVGALPTGGSYIIMEFIEFGVSRSNQPVLGRKLAEMHKVAKSKKGFGFDVDNTIGSTPQMNTWTSDWIEFYAKHRLGYQLKLARDQYGDSTIYEKGQRLIKNMGSLFENVVIFDPKFHNILYGDAKGWPGRIFSFLNPYIPGVMNPHTKVVQQWNKFVVISCLVAIFVDPLFFFLLSVQQDNKCIVISWPLTTAIVVFRSMTDFIYFIHILLQFRLAYVAPESRVVGAGELVDHPKKIALNYLFGYFLIDLFIVLPLPQIIILLVIPRSLSRANFAKNLLRAAVLVQYIPRLYRFLPLMVGQSPSGFTFESAWANFVMNLLTFVLSGHVVGSCWYLFGLQRVNQCLRNACRDSGMQSCTKFIDCGHGNNTESFKSDATWTNWTINENATACFNGGFSYGIYVQAVNLTTEHSIITRYIYSFFWGFQQISTLAGNQIPSYFVWEILFTTAIIGLGLLLFALLIGNMQNFLQALGRRRLEMSLRRRDVEQWMSHRRLPEDLKRQVRQSERYNWAATRGVNEEMLLENLPEDLQRDIRRHLFKFVKKVRIFALMDEPILDAICERLRQRTYIEGSKILYRGGPIEKMAFIVRGKMESIGEEGIPVALSEGDVCGEELLAWCLEHSSLNKGRRKGSIPGQRLLSNRMVRCFTNVEAFTLRAADIEEVTNLFSRFLRNPRVQGAIRYESPYWRGLAARRIQVAWRYRKKRLNRADTANSESATQSVI